MSLLNNSGEASNNRFSLNLLLGVFHLLSLITRGIYWLWIVTKWAFAPVMFLINVIVLMPIGKLTLKMPVTLEIGNVTEDELPYAVWCEFKNITSELGQEGFEVQKYVLTTNLVSNTHYYMLSMINAHKVQGVGINILVHNKADLEDSELPMGSQVGVEFSTCYGSKKVVDLTNYEHLTPFPTENIRTRLLLKDASVRALYRIFDNYEAQAACKITPEIFNQLRYEPGAILTDEYQLLIKQGLEEGYLTQKKDFYKLTWKGVLSSGLRTVWPTSVWFHQQIHKQTMNEMALHGMQVDELWRYESEPFISKELEQVCNTLSDALEIAQTNVTKYAAIIPEIDMLLVSVEIQQPDHETPESYSFNFLQCQRFPRRITTLLQEISINIYNHEAQIVISSGLPDFYYKDEMEYLNLATPLLNELTPYLKVSEVIKICRQESTVQPIEDIYSLYLSIENDVHQWRVDYETAEQQFAYVIIDATNGKVIESDKNEY